MTQDFDPTAVKRAAMKYRQLASDIQIRVEAIAGRLNECGGMAGNDNGAKDFCQHYDPAAKDGIEAGAYAVNALNTCADLLFATAVNHENGRRGAIGMARVRRRLSVLPPIPGPIQTHCSC